MFSDIRDECKKLDNNISIFNLEKKVFLNNLFNKDLNLIKQSLNLTKELESMKMREDKASKKERENEADQEQIKKYKEIIINQMKKIMGLYQLLQIWAQQLNDDTEYFKNILSQYPYFDKQKPINNYKTVKLILASGEPALVQSGYHSISKVNNLETMAVNCSGTPIMHSGFSPNLNY